MAQTESEMELMLCEDAEAAVSKPYPPTDPSIDLDQRQRSMDETSHATRHEKNAKLSRFIMMPIIPILWCILLLATMDREMITSTYAMPLLGICSASLANAVPVGGGIVFVPILALFGVQLKLGAAFAVATMTFGNGVFGFLSWMEKDPASIAWRVVPYAVVPAWVGAALGTFHPFLSPEQCRRLFAAFCIAVAAIVGKGIYQRQGVNDGKAKPFSIMNEREEINTVGGETQRKVMASCFSFVAGLVLVSHIGIGNAMTTFLVCTFVWSLPAKSAVVTGILVGGWTSIMPFGIHLLIFRDVPIALWVMGLPGVYLGARIAPLVHERLGITNVLIAFIVFLLGTAILMLTI
eukprot:CAMPEP_0172506714 /NCGR_PEP_ID=MMETSP1066-20121228/197561_1 /TAXON_ID=671091 /ORGANISM="Coscinodiscus wailesii, Strain CCMP2513" /LENGTH=349 /DNA_ID=CAMNT_0013283863 /DNA_START=17 /DNA_END=1066 /DNA_ORIENTATION=-